MAEIIAVALLLPMAAGTWWISRHVHPAILILVGAGLSSVGTPTNGGPFFLAVHVLGLIVIVHGIFLWGKRTGMRQPPAAV